MPTSVPCALINQLKAIRGACKATNKKKKSTLAQKQFKIRQIPMHKSDLFLYTNLIDAN